MGAADSEVSIRQILPGEEKTVREFFEKNLGIIDSIIFQLSVGHAMESARQGTGTTLVAALEGEIVGTVSMRLLDYKRKRVGLIGAIATGKNLRGKGIGKSLLDRALSWLQQRECQTIYATADRYNSPSWNMFVHKGFTVCETLDQIRELGLDFLRLWLTEFYFIAIGVFFLRKSREEERPRNTSEARNLLTAWVGLTFAWWILALKGNAPPTLYPLLLGITAMTILGHEFAHRLVSNHYGLGTTFKAWDSGLLFGLFLAVLGVVFPAYGSTYIGQLDWAYEPPTRRMGLVYASGPVASLILATLFLALGVVTSNTVLTAAMKGGYTINIASTVLNLLPIKAAGGFPWDGRNILPRKKALWSLLVIGVAVLILGDVFLLP